jgi:hypothetical protein
MSTFRVIRFRKKIPNEFVDKITKLILCSTLFFPENLFVCELMRKMRYSWTQNTSDNIIWRVRFSWWLDKDRDTHSDCVQIFHVNISYTTAPQYYG